MNNVCHIDYMSGITEQLLVLWIVTGIDCSEVDYLKEVVLL